jgi:hypothetical protein
METGVMVVSVGVFVLLGFTLVGGPMVLADWVRKRREAMVARQVALTDALDERLGVIVAPVVTKPLFGPWEVRVAVPFVRSTVLARMFSVIDDVFAGREGMESGSYRILLTVPRDSRRAESEHRAPGSTNQWAGIPLGV